MLQFKTVVDYSLAGSRLPHDICAIISEYGRPLLVDILLRPINYFGSDVHEWLLDTVNTTTRQERYNFLLVMQKSIDGRNYHNMIDAFVYQDLQNLCAIDNNASFVAVCISCPLRLINEGLQAKRVCGDTPLLLDSSGCRVMGRINGFMNFCITCGIGLVKGCVMSDPLGDYRRSSCVLEFVTEAPPTRVKRLKSCY